MDDVKFKPRAYEGAAKTIEASPESIEEIYRRGGIRSLLQISGVGKSIAQKIEEFIKTGQIQYYEELKKKVPVDLEGLSQIEGLGPKRIKSLWQALGIRNINQLEKAAQAHKICKVPGFQERTEQNILKSIEFARRSRGRYVLGFVLPLINEIESRLKSLPEVRKVAVAGSVRRMKETIGDADLLVVSGNPKRVTEYFVSMPEVELVQAMGETKSTVRLQSGMHCDLRIVPEESFGSALQYFTGSKDHNIGVRTIPIQKGLKLNEYGLFKGGRQIAGRTEEEIYKILGLACMPPELRENWGEIEAAKRGQLPKLIGYGDLKGDLQVHTNWADGKNSILEMAQAAKQLGLEYIAITDHTKSLAMANGLDEKGLEKQAEKIEKANDEIEGIRILKGAEVNISKDGSLDVADIALEKLDVVGAAVHSHFNLSKEEQTRRIITAMRNPNVDMLFHPTGRIIKQREPYAIDIAKVIDVAAETGTILEVDAFPDRLDLSDEYIKLAIQEGCKISIDSDAHTTSHLQLVKFGIAQARRGWARVQDVVNSNHLNEFLASLKA
jgi:DNA polymerase (family 10)